MARPRWVDAALEVLADEGYVGPRHIFRVRLLARSLLDAAPDGPLVDAGCGFGTMAAALADEGRTVLAFDIDRRRVGRAGELAEAMGLAERVHLFVADATAIPLANGSLAGAGCGEVLEHLEDDAAAAAELARVLRRGGALAVTVPAGADRYTSADLEAGHFRRYDRPDLEGLLEAAGLTVEQSTAWALPASRLCGGGAGRVAGRLLAKHVPALVAPMVAIAAALTSGRAYPVRRTQVAARAADLLVAVSLSEHC